MKVLLASICSMLAASACSSLRHPPRARRRSPCRQFHCLAGVAAATTALLLDAGVKPQNAGGGVFVLDAKNFHCDQNLNGALDASNVRAGCRRSNAGSTPRTSAAPAPVNRSARAGP
jgi:hypothetical protein